VQSLQGGDIETYTNELFRAWKLGQAQKNNGVLLLVAPNEHKVRIEVGYGLEGTLTDALAPSFRASRKATSPAASNAALTASSASSAATRRIGSRKPRRLPSAATTRRVR
jgi:uncharacterized membrane protein YgcG